jgi:4-carboxymuconolactone decarboxylase
MKKKPALEFLESLDENTVEAMSDLRIGCGELADAFVEYLYGNVYQRGGLSLRERMLVTMSALMVCGDKQPQLMTQVRIAIKNGISREDVLEIAHQLSAFVGFSTALNAMGIVNAVSESCEIESKCPPEVTTNSDEAKALSDGV